MLVDSNKKKTRNKKKHNNESGSNMCPSFIPVLNSPSGMKKAPTVMPTSTNNLKNQKLRRNKTKCFYS